MDNDKFYAQGRFIFNGAYRLLIDGDIFQKIIFSCPGFVIFDLRVYGLEGYRLIQVDKGRIFLHKALQFDIKCGPGRVIGRCADFFEQFVKFGV
jgi:hypothetical protein